MRRGGSASADPSSEARNAKFVQDQKAKRKRDKMHIKDFIEQI